MTTKRDYAKLNAMRTEIDKFIDGYADMTPEQYDNWTFKVTVMMEDWCTEYNKVNDGRKARVENRTIILN